MVSILVYYNGAGALAKDDYDCKYNTILPSTGKIYKCASRPNQSESTSLSINLMCLYSDHSKINELYEQYKVSKLKYPIVGIHPTNNW